MRKLTAEQWAARGIAYNEAAEHLLAHWTDDPLEILESVAVNRMLEAEASKCFEKQSNMLEDEKKRHK